MKDKFQQLEILLLRETMFHSMKLIEGRDEQSPKLVSEDAKLQEACWNYFRDLVAPQIFGKQLDPEMFIWGIHSIRSFIELEIAAAPVQLDNAYSINPHCFMERIFLN